MTHQITGIAYPRLGLLGNPMDALGGAAISLTFRDFEAQAIIEPSQRLILKEPLTERPEWDTLADLQRHIARFGFRGGRRLMMALLARIARYARENSIRLPERNFRLTWQSTIPRHVGLAGSSALLTAALRAIVQFWELEIPLLDQVDIVLKTECVDLGIPAGPQDRVAQVFEGLVFLEPGGDGRLHVDVLDSTALPPLFVAINEAASEGTEVFHSDLRARFEKREPAVLQGLQTQTNLARAGRQLLENRRGGELGPLMDENFAVRRSVTTLNPRHVRMVEVAKGAGAHAKFAGSGGAIVGTCALDAIQKVIDALTTQGYRAFQPTIHDPRRRP